MRAKNSRIEDINEFFQKKLQVRVLLEQFEKKNFEASSILESALEILAEMETIALKRKAYYFLHRTRRIRYELEDLKEKKGYRKKEFDIAYKTLEKIDENENSEFLDKILKGKIEKIAGTIAPQEKTVVERYPRHRKYMTFTFRNVSFIVEKKPLKIIRNVNPYKSFVRIGKSRYPIYPGPHFGLSPSPDGISDPTHLCILTLSSGERTREIQIPLPEKSPTYRCFFFHTMDKEILFDESTVRSRLKSLEEGVSPYIQRYFRYAGRNYYLIETDTT